jgi:hypothetical protein
VRYTAQWGKWHLWDGQRWAEDRKRKTFNMARTICREVAVDMKGDRKKMIASNRTKMGVLGLIMDDQRLAAVAEQWDAVQLAGLPLREGWKPASDGIGSCKPAAEGRPSAS